jgi:hypothetical protein
MVGIPFGWFAVAYTAPPVNYMSGPIVVVIVGLLAVSVVLAILFASPLAVRLTERRRNRPPRGSAVTDAGDDSGSPWSTNVR